MNKFLDEISKGLAESCEDTFFESDSRTLENLGEQITHLRKAKGFSQKELSLKTHITQSNISRIENGKYNLTISLLNRIMNALDAHIVLEANNDKQ